LVTQTHPEFTSLVEPILTGKVIQYFQTIKQLVVEMGTGVQILERALLLDTTWHSRGLPDWGQATGTSATDNGM